MPILKTFAQCKWLKAGPKMFLIGALNQQRPVKASQK